MIKQLAIHNFETEIKEQVPVIVEFYAPSCGHCRKMEGVLGQLSEELAGQAVFAKCNISEEQALQARWDITSLPTILFFKDGVEKNKLIGEVHPLIIKEEIKKLG